LATHRLIDPSQQEAMHSKLVSYSCKSFSLRLKIIAYRQYRIWSIAIQGEVAADRQGAAPIGILASVGRFGQPPFPWRIFGVELKVCCIGMAFSPAFHNGGYCQEKQAGIH
jgi:hypothetical protein